MNEDIKEILKSIGWIVLAWAVLIIINFAGKIDGEKRGIEIMQKEAISLGKATYNTTNRSFEWKK